MRTFVRFASVVSAVLLAYVVVFGQSGDFETTGRVLVGGNPFQGATVTYTSAARSLSWDFSRADGTFGINVGVKQPLGQNPKVTMFANGPVTIEVYDMAGKKIETVNGKLDKGTYFLEPLSTKLAKSMYLLKIRAGNNVTCQKMLNTGAKNNGYTVVLSSSSEPVVMAKKLANADTVRIGRTGYTPVYIPIVSYGLNIGDQTLTTVDIEGEVNTKLAALSQTQKCAQLCMPPTQDVNTIVNNNCGSLFGGGGALLGSSASACANGVDAVQTAMMNGSLKIPVLAAYDFVHGASAVPGATMLPHNLAMGAIQDTLLIQKAFRVCALEVRGSGCNWGYGPCIAVIRDDRWGRAYEGFCETPERTQIMARHAVLGGQLTDLSNPLTYAMCCKHFAGDGNTANGVNAGTTVGPDATARAINLPGYASAVKTGVATIMPSFSKWCDGTPMHINKTLMTGYLKSDSIGFQGFIVGDWDAATLGTSEQAGLDVEMAPEASTGIIGSLNGIYAANQARLDDAVKRVLRVKYWMNLFDSRQYTTNRALTALVGSAAHRTVARQCVAASQVLLKNTNNVLPMAKTANLAIWGTAGDNIGIQCGGWTVSWQGQQGPIPGGGGTSIKTACQAVDANVSYVASPGAVGTSDYILAVLSENPYAETSFGAINLTGDDATGSNQAVITEIAAAHTAGKKVIGMLIAGRVLDITSVIDNCDAFIWSGLPGTEGAGISDVLFGDVKFSGKLPVTWPMNLAQEPINSGDGQTGRFAYGFGLTD
ncbi:MAG TPA: glycoside hydrolase family 3 N-terminal domain-containing protein [Chitinivibrionales bacterium]|nr:glycoside hydrolase family 3 N-terminal domain-containing protein [Chitinivibrionales bacterium]